MTKKELGQKLKKIRLERNVSTYKMQTSGLRFEPLNAIENGQGYNIDTLFKYLDIVGIKLTPSIDND